VQLLQVVRGGQFPELRTRPTLDALQRVAKAGLMPQATADALSRAYVFLRRVEHRIQYLDDAQTHVLPASEDDRLMLARAMGYDDTPALLNALRTHADWVAARFDEMFDDKSSPEIGTSNDLQGLSFDEATEEVIAAHLKQLGFDDAPIAAQRLLSSWRSNRIQSLPLQRKGQLEVLLRASLPMIIQAADSVSRSATLNRLLDFFDTIARRSAYLALLTEYPHTLARVIRMMAASDWAAKYLTRHPVLMDELLDDAILHTEPDWQAFAQECRQRLEAFDGDTERQMDVLREQHHAQLFRLLAQDLDGVLGVERLADHLSALADVLISVTLSAVWQTIPNRHREVPAFSVIAYGKLGGKELGYGSDLDIVFVYEDPHESAAETYAAFVRKLINWLTTKTAEGDLFEIDTALRPNGSSGLLVTTFDAFAAYQQQRGSNTAWTWEHQAMTRARFCLGSDNLRTRFDAVRASVINAKRDPLALQQEIIAMRDKLSAARPVKPDVFDVKHSAGGMVDVEFAVQYLVLAFARQHPALLANVGNIQLLERSEQAGLLPEGVGVAAGNAYRALRKVQHQARLDELATQIPIVQANQWREDVLTLWQAVFGK